MSTPANLGEQVQGLQTMSSEVANAHNYNTWIVKTFKPFIRGNLLEVGTGRGNFKSSLLPFSKEYISIDIDSEAVREAQVEDPNGEYHCLDIASSELSVLDERDLDTIVCFNVLEHIYDHRVALNNMLNILNPNGHLLLFVPAHANLFNDLDALAGHHRRYNKKSFKNLGQGLQAEMLRCDYFNPIGGLGWWVNKFFKHDNLDSKDVNQQVVFFDRFLVPVSQFFNGLTRGFFGQSMVIVLKKAS